MSFTFPSRTELVAKARLINHQLTSTERVAWVLGTSIVCLPALWSSWNFLFIVYNEILPLMYPELNKVIPFHSSSEDVPIFVVLLPVYFFSAVLLWSAGYSYFRIKIERMTWLVLALALVAVSLYLIEDVNVGSVSYALLLFITYYCTFVMHKIRLRLITKGIFT